MLTDQEAIARLEQIMGQVSAPEARLNLSALASQYVRFANNQITVPGEEDQVRLTLTVSFGKKQAAARTNDLSPAGLESLINRAEELAKAMPGNPEVVPELGPQQYDTRQAFVQATAALTPEARANLARVCIESARANKLIAAGFVENRHSLTGIATKAGCRGLYRRTELRLSLSNRAGDGLTSAWTGISTTDAGQVAAGELADEVWQKIQQAKERKPINPGRYPVILEHNAVAALLDFLVYALEARAADEGRSFFAKPKGGTRKGEKLFSPLFSLRSDPESLLHTGSTFDRYGVPTKRRFWIKDGVLTELYVSPVWAAKSKAAPTARPRSLVVPPGELGIEEMVAKAHKALLVSRFHYCNFLDPQSLYVTGLTRDGTFWIENGKIAHAVPEMRFAVKLSDVFGGIDLLGLTVKTLRGPAVPPLMVKGLTFTAVAGE